MVAVAKGVKTLISGYKSKWCKASSIKLEAVMDKFKLD